MIVQLSVFWSKVYCSTNLIISLDSQRSKIFLVYNFRTWWDRICLYIAFQNTSVHQLKTQIWHFREPYLNHGNGAKITFYISISINTKFENNIRMCFISNFVHKTQFWEIPRVAAVRYGGSYAMIKLYSAVIITRHIYNFKVFWWISNQNVLKSKD